jgi:hypothetical protein
VGRGLASLRFATGRAEDRTPSSATGDVSARSVAASYKPPMLVTRVRLPACAYASCPWLSPLLRGQELAPESHSRTSEGGRPAVQVQAWGGDASEGRLAMRIFGLLVFFFPSEGHGPAKPRCSLLRRGGLPHGYIAQWLERLTADQQVPGSNPGVPSAMRARICLPQGSLHWGLNPGPSVYKTDALPLSYRGTASQCTSVLAGCSLRFRSLLGAALVSSPSWTHWGLNPGPSACEADVIPLHHVPLRGSRRCLVFFLRRCGPSSFASRRYASLAQLAEHALRKRMVVGSIPTGGYVAGVNSSLSGSGWLASDFACRLGFEPRASHVRC